MSVTVDRESLLAEVDANATLGEVKTRLSSEGLTLDIADLASHREKAVGTWLADGAPGTRDPWLDPADHVLAGLDATLPDGTLLSIRPAPRRSTGPDLVALACGMRGRFVTITRAWLRIHRRDVPRPSTEPFHAPRNAPVSAEEEALLREIAHQLTQLR